MKKKNAQHTAGPWSIDPSDYRGGEIHILSYSGENIAAAFPGEDGGIPEGAANARLIAAAPELLAALREFIPLPPDSSFEWLKNPAGTDEAILSMKIRRAVAAIAKAEGRNENT